MPLRNLIFFPFKTNTLGHPGGRYGDPFPVSWHTPRLGSIGPELIQIFGNEWYWYGIDLSVVFLLSTTSSASPTQGIPAKQQLDLGS